MLALGIRMTTLLTRMWGWYCPRPRVAGLEMLHSQHRAPDAIDMSSVDRVLRVIVSPRCPGGSRPGWNPELML